MGTDNDNDNNSITTSNTTTMKTAVAAATSSSPTVCHAGTSGKCDIDNCLFNCTLFKCINYSKGCKK